MFGRVGKEEHEKVVKANSRLRARIEKLRLENALLKDQIRVLKSLPPEMSSVYVLVQSKMSTTVENLRKDPQIAAMGEEKLGEALKKLVESGLVEERKKGGELHYSVKTPTLS